ncbi:ABC transporter ATP-binding protein [Myceligenerans crystallogenes]|uniref:ABC transporter ATP-binding protein n=1 Tax=Myceligenerans crystallogenes TaxID=316335 RepID=A0ABP4ZI86_9MICO
MSVTSERSPRATAAGRAIRGSAVEGGAVAPVGPDAATTSGDATTSDDVAPRSDVAVPPVTSDAFGSAPALLEADGLTVAYRGTEVVHGVSLRVAPGEVVALVGESGSGKSTIARALTGLLPDGGVVTGGRAALGGQPLTGLTPRAWQDLRGARLGFVPQDTGSALDPVARIGDQVAEALVVHGTPRAAARERAVRILHDVGLDAPAARARQYPHQLSGGMRQRVLIGLALANRPGLVVADEPTSALDVTLQRHILDLLTDPAGTRGERPALLLVTHDLALAAERADRVLVMRHGRIVDEGRPGRVLGAPRHAYSRELVEAAAPGAGRTAVAGPPAAAPVLEVRDLAKAFRLPGGGLPLPGRGRPGAGLAFPGWRERGTGATEPGGRASGTGVALPGTHGPDPSRPGGRASGTAGLRAVDGVSFAVAPGETFALVGESGSGKTTIARLVLGLERADAGTVVLGGRPLGRDTRELRRRSQLVHQDPSSSLDPRFTVAAAVAEPLVAHRTGTRAERRDRVAALLEAVHLSPDLAGCRPAELSGGQRQRVAVARALALDPELLVLDEPTSALDASVQARVLDLLVELQESCGTAFLLVTHDLAVVRRVAHRVAVLRRGRVVEQGAVTDILDHPREQYTRELVAAVPRAALGHDPAALAGAPTDEGEHS